MLIAYTLTVLLATGIIAWLWRQEAERSHFLLALYGVAAVSVGQALWVIGGHPPVVVQLIIHGLLWLWVLWACGLIYWGVPLALAATLLAFVFPRDILAGLSWGLAAVLPPLAWAIWRRPLTSSPPPPTQPDFSTPIRIASHDQRQLLQYVDEGVVVSDAQGIVEFANSAAVQVLGAPVDQIIGQPIMDLLAHLPMLAGSNLTDAKPRLQFEMNGRLLEGRMDVMYSDGQFMGSIAVLRDITDSFQSQRAKSAFLTTISHELRTPLTSIKGYVELLSSEMAGKLNEEQRQFSAIIQRNVTRMVQLVNSMIFVSTVRGGRLEPKLVYADLRQLTQQIVREMEPAAVRSQQSFHVEIDPRLKPIQADSIHVSTMLQELVNNSMKYNQAGGVVRIQIELEPGENNPQEFVVVRVSDNGIGIPADEQLHIFDDFYRVDKGESSARASGMGVGLSIVRALVEAYNGRIWLESSLGQGSTFSFILPARQVTINNE